MAGRLVKLDRLLLAEFATDKFKVAIYGSPYDHEVRNLATAEGHPKTVAQMQVIPVRCSECGVWVKLSDAAIMPQCPKCGQLYWPADFAAALPTMMRLDPQVALAALLLHQEQCFVYPVKA